ncbi:MAG: hydrogenase maturation protease [Kineosporiaceae bacterium]
MTPRPLVIGYGNPLRRDDGLGWHAASVLALSRPGGARVLQRHQLTPELAVDVAAASEVVFVDARPADGAGIRVEEVTPEYGALSWTHHLTPGELLGLASLCGHAPPRAWLVSAPVTCTEPGEGLTPPEQELLPQVLARVAELVTPTAPAATG